MNSLSNKVLEFVKGSISSGRTFTSQQVVNSINSMSGIRYPESNIVSLLGIFAKQGYFTAKGYTVSEVGRGFKFAKVVKKAKVTKVAKVATIKTIKKTKEVTEYKVSSDGRINLPNNNIACEYFAVRINGDKLVLTPTTKSFNKEVMVKNAKGIKVPNRFLGSINAFAGSYVDVDVTSKNITISNN